MIVLLGSSYTRGAWGDHMDQPAAFVHTMLANELQCDVVNMSIPGSGSEKFVDAYIHAVDKYNPSLFLAELVEDRSGYMLYLPNAVSQSIADQSAGSIHDHSFQYGLPNSDYVENCMEAYRIHYATIALPSTSKLLIRNQRMFNDCYIRNNEYNMHTLLDWMNTLNVFHQSGPLQLMRTVTHFMSLEKLSKLTGIPVLYYSYHQTLNYEAKLISHIQDRHMNTWHSMSDGTCQWANNKLNGQHLADNTHLNKQADELVIKELTAPFIKYYATTHNIIL